MANELTRFEFHGKGVRTVTINGEPWFVAKDVCDILEIQNHRDALTRIPEKQKGVASTDTLGGMQNLSIISEAGLYRLVLRSDKPQAEPFIGWVTEEVLPQIRKTGRYEARPQTPALLPLPGEIASREFEALRKIAETCGYVGNQALLAADKAVRKLHNISPVALLEIELKSPDNEKYLIATEVGRLFQPEMSPVRVNALLRELGFMERRERLEGKWQNYLTDKGKEYGIYLDTGKKHSDGTPIQQIKWKESVVPLLRSYLDE